MQHTLASRNNTVTAKPFWKARLILPINKAKARVGILFVEDAMSLRSTFMGTEPFEYYLHTICVLTMPTRIKKTCLCKCPNIMCKLSVAAAAVQTFPKRWKKKKQDRLTENAHYQQRHRQRDQLRWQCMWLCFQNGDRHKTFEDDSEMRDNNNNKKGVILFFTIKKRKRFNISMHRLTCKYVPALHFSRPIYKYLQVWERSLLRKGAPLTERPGNNTQTFQDLHTHIFKAYVEVVSIFMASFIKLVMVWQVFYTMNTHRKHIFSPLWFLKIIAMRSGSE